MAHASQLDANSKHLLSQVANLSQELLTQQPAPIGKVYVQCSVLSVAKSIHFPYLQKQLALVYPKPTNQLRPLAWHCACLSVQKAACQWTALSHGGGHAQGALA